MQEKLVVELQENIKKGRVFNFRIHLLRLILKMLLEKRENNQHAVDHE